MRLHLLFLILDGAMLLAYPVLYIIYKVRQWKKLKRP